MSSPTSDERRRLGDRDRVRELEEDAARLEAEVAQLWVERRVLMDRVLDLSVEVNELRGKPERGLRQWVRRRLKREETTWE